MPVTTPIAKLIAKIFAQKRAALVVMLVAGAQRHGLQNHEQQRQPHGQLRKDVVERYGKSEMQPVNRERRIHKRKEYQLSTLDLTVLRVIVHP